MYNHLGINYDVQRTTRVACIFARFVRKHRIERDEKQEENPREPRSLSKQEKERVDVREGIREGEVEKEKGKVYVKLQ